MKTLTALFLLGIIASSLACGYSSHTTPTQAGVVPAISALAPTSATSGSAGFTLTVNGSNFSTKSVVNWNGTAQTTVYVSAAQIMAAIAASNIASPATVTISVTNPGTAGTGQYGSGGTAAETSNTMNFTVN